MIEAAVLENNEVDQELLLSLSLLIKWDLVPPDFPNRTVSEYFNESMTKRSNKQVTTYSSLYTKQTQALEEQENSEYKLPEPSRKRKGLRKNF